MPGAPGRPTLCTLGRGGKKSPNRGGRSGVLTSVRKNRSERPQAAWPGKWRRKFPLDLNHTSTGPRLETPVIMTVILYIFLIFSKFCSSHKPYTVARYRTPQNAVDASGNEKMSPRETSGGVQTDSAAQPRVSPANEEAIQSCVHTISSRSCIAN